MLRLLAELDLAGLDRAHVRAGVRQARRELGGLCQLRLSREPVRSGAPQRPRSSGNWRCCVPSCFFALVDRVDEPKALGWIQYFLALDAYVDGRFEAAAEHAAVSVEKARESGHEFMLASAAATGLLARSARDGEIRQAELAETVQLMQRPGVPPLVAFALWFVARYAAGVDPSASGRWLAHAARIVESLDSDLWPECELREESMTVLGIGDLAPLLAATPPLDPAQALAEAAAWLAVRPGHEAARRTVSGQLSAAAG